MAVSHDTIEAIKGLPLSSVLAAEDVFLRRVGREFVTHCLWHKDSNPSLTVSDDKGFVFCHVCQHHDDAIGFIQQKFGVSFVDSCERIAGKHGISFTTSDENSAALAKRRKELEYLYSTVEKQQQYFREQLGTSLDVIKFIQSRDIKPEVSRFFGFGFNRADKRLTIPIKDYKGQIVGFTARTILPDIKPKYKNTENNDIFHKSDIVFNEYNASSFIREADECIFVEGHLDVVSVWQYGIKNVVALQGTASPSPQVINRLLKKTNRFVLCMDADDGGRKAVSNFLRSVHTFALNGKLGVRIATLPAGMDPDEFIKSGGNLANVISDAPSWLDWILDSWLNELDFSDKLKIQEVEKQIKDLFSQISSPALRAHYYDKASIRLAQNKQAIAAEIAKSFHENDSRELHVSGWKRPDAAFTRKLVEKRILRLYINKPEMRPIIKPLLDMLHFPVMIWLKNRIFEVESIGNGNFTSEVLMAILCVSEQQYPQALRPIVSPNIILYDDDMSVAFMEDVMMASLPSE